MVSHLPAAPNGSPEPLPMAAKIVMSVSHLYADQFGAPASLPLESAVLAAAFPVALDVAVVFAGAQKQVALTVEL